MTLDDILAAAYPVMPMLVIENPAQALPLAQILVGNNVRVLEITLRTEAALAAIRIITKHIPEAMVGAGTVLTHEQLRQVKAAGAQFVVSPGTTERMLTAARQLDMALIPGVASASEIQLALEFGCQWLKFFPAAAAGGPAVLQALYGPFPQVRFCPTGGIDAQTAPAYLKLPNVVCVGGSWLTPTALLEAGDWPAIGARARP
jgi:2-dehydro-3-deoxyphosphogluconate aldolase / (4S)-4-hydroxy-2-oxoglutarate aldolase